MESRTSENRVRPSTLLRRAHGLQLADWREERCAPVERFLKIEAASGVLLLLDGARRASAWANSPLRDWYSALWHTPFGVRLGLGVRA